MVAFRYGPQVCGSLTEGTAREWLVADGRGGYAMGTVCGLRTRRYHGLLVVSTTTPARRMMALAALDPVLTLPSGAEVRLCTHEWRSGAVAPAGHELLAAFELRDGLPRWQWRVGDIVLERTLAVRDASVGVVHTLVGGGPVRLTLEPLCTWRDAHGERHAGQGLAVTPTADGFVVEGTYRVAGPGFVADEAWYLGVYHREEAARGLAATEDLYRPGRFSMQLNTGEVLEVSAWAGDQGDLATPPPPARDVVAQARRRARGLACTGADEPTRALTLAADAFIIRTSSGPDVVAGYPWFGSWSRDTMISYEGLFLATGRADEGRELLRAYGQTLSHGMLANTADTGQVEYNTADATLWFLHAAERHISATDDTDLAAELIDALDQVVSHHVTGTRFGIRVDPSDGLLAQGAEGYALTWMDARVDGVPVTARHGKAVELNALWVNGLAALATLRQRLRRPADDLEALRAHATAAFRRTFPNERGWLHDVVGPGGVDPALRPNQLFAFSLPHAPMRGSAPDPTPVHAVAQALLTPLGLRTLARDHPDYRGRHRGDAASRDRAYHQGTVWPWLIGAYADAARMAKVGTQGLLNGLVAHLAEWGIGSISETADGDPPHRATGCPFQAWSVAEALRVLRTA